MAGVAPWFDLIIRVSGAVLLTGGTGGTGGTGASDARKGGLSAPLALSLFHLPAYVAVVVDRDPFHLTMIPYVLP